MLSIPAYEHDGPDLVQSYKLATGNIVSYRARDVTRERTGIHGRVAIQVNHVTLAWSTFNIERDEDRVRLSNSAYTAWGDSAELDKADWPKTSLKKALDIFCEDLWNEIVSKDLGGLLAGNATEPPAKRLLGDYVLQEGGTIAFGPPGGGKSYTAGAMAVCCAWGIEKVWRVYDAWTPLYINVERSARSMAARLGRLNLCFGLAPETPLPFLNARGRSLSDIYEAAKRTLANESCRWVVYDSISRAGFGSLKEDDNANRIMDMLNALCPTWLALAHSPRADDTHAFGSQMFDAAADVTIQLRSQTATDGYSTGIGMQGIKANDIRLPRLRIHVFEWDDGGLCGCRAAEKGEFAELEASQRKSKEDQAREYLLSVGELTAGQVAEHFSWPRSHTSQMLNAARWTRKEKRGKEVYFQVEERVPF